MYSVAKTSQNWGVEICHKFVKRSSQKSFKFQPPIVSARFFLFFSPGLLALGLVPWLWVGLSLFLLNKGPCALFVAKKKKFVLVICSPSNKHNILQKLEAIIEEGNLPSGLKLSVLLSPYILYTVWVRDCRYSHLVT
jgi:hypothetical protein